MKRKQTLTKADIVQMVYNKMGYTKQFNKDLVEEFFHILKGFFKKGQGIQIYGFGKFTLKNKKARPGRNLQTGKAMTISKRRVLLFHPSTILKKRF